MRLKNGRTLLLAGCLLLAACSSQTTTPVGPAAGIASPVTVLSNPTSTPAPEQVVQPVPSTTVPLASPTQVPEQKPSVTPTVMASPEIPVPGVEMHHIAPEGGLQLVVEAGAHWVRRNALQWPNVESQPGTYDWGAVADLEAELVNASEQGLETILIVHRTPSWAQQIPGALCGPVSEDQLGAYADFLRAAVERYSAPPYHVKYWELGNEPDVDPSLIPPEMPFGCWGDLDDPNYGGGYYAQMLKAAYPAMKAADPEAQILVGGLLLDCDPVDPPVNQAGVVSDCTPSRFLEGILENGGGEFFDGVSFHGYDYYPEIPGLYVNVNWHSASNSTGPVLIAKSRYLRSVLAKYGYTDKFLINTESAIVCLANEVRCRTEGLEQTKANYIAQANAAALAEGLRGNVWYSINGWRYSDMVNAQLQPYPVMDAFKFSSRQLAGATFSRAVDDFPGLMGYEFIRDGKIFWILWSLDGEEHTVELPSPPSAVYDLFGEPLPKGPEVQVNLSPVYIHW